MVRFFAALILAGFAVAESQAQVVSSSPTSSAAPQASPAASTSTSASRFEQLRKAFEQLSAEQQERILQNFHRWQDLSQDEKEVLRQRERVQRQKLDASLNEAYQKSGLQLNDEQRAQFHKRYLQERRRLEEQLVHDMQEKRQAGNAAIAGLSQISQLADALEALLKELYEKPKSINASTLRTVASAIDFLPTLLEQGRLPGADVAVHPRPDILVVDDEAISRRAISYALEKAKLPCTSLESPEVAVDLLAQRKWDLIFLDVDMPGMNGFELCTKLRSFQRNKTTPVVFVTSLTDFESRANSTMSGGNDLIAKPFLFMELAVKALVYLMRGRLAAK